MPAVAAEQRLATCESEIARLYEAHADQLLGYCLRRSSSRSDAEDAVQTTFLYALRALRRGVVPECEPAWLTAIAKNVCRWQWRTLDRRGPLSGEIDPDMLEAGEGGAPEDDELCHALSVALASLPESQRRALVLREWHGLSSSEVADQLGMSAPATYALLTRARRSMAQALTAIPRQAALGLATLVYELRSHWRALAGSGQLGRTVAATSAAVALTAGGVSLERGARGDRGIAQATEPRAGAPASDAQALEAQRGIRALGPARRAGAPSGMAGVGGVAESTGARTLPTPASPSSEAAAPAQGREDTAATGGSDLAPVTDLLSEPPPPQELLSEPLPLPSLPAELLPPTPAPPPAPSLPPSESVPPLEPPALPPLPDPQLPGPLP